MNRITADIWKFPIAIAVWCMVGTAVWAGDSPVTAIAFSSDGRSVVIGSQAGVGVRRWPGLDVVKALQQEFATTLVNVHDLAFSPDGQSLAVAGGAPSEEGRVDVFAWPSGRKTFSCQGHKDSVMSACWRSDSEFASAGLDHDIVIWNADTGERTRRLQGHSRGVSAVAYLTNENLLVSAGLDNNLRVWNPDTGEMIRTLNNHTGVIHALSVRPRTSGLPMIASVSDDRTVRLWQPSIGRMVRFAQLDAVPLAVDWLPDGSRLVVAADDGHVRVINPDTVGITQNLPAVDGWAYAVAVHPSDGSLLIGGAGGQIKRIVLRSEAPEKVSD